MTADKTQPTHIEDGIGVTDQTLELYQQDETIVLDIDAVKGGDANALKLANDGHVSFFTCNSFPMIMLIYHFRQF